MQCCFYSWTILYWQVMAGGFQNTWKASAGIRGESGQQTAVDAVHFDLVLHAEALEALSSVKEIPDPIKES